MREPGLSAREFLRDRVLFRECLFDISELSTLPGAVREMGGAFFSATHKLSIDLECSSCDLSRFNQLCITVLNRSGTPLLAGLTLFHRSCGQAYPATPVSFSGGREHLSSGGWTELKFPEESFGSYGSPEGWEAVCRVELIFCREKTEAPGGAIDICLRAVHGETREIPCGPRLTEEGLMHVLRPWARGIRKGIHCATTKDRFWREHPLDLSPGEPYTVNNRTIAIPPPHPYPQESAEEVLAGRVMGQRLTHPIDWRANPLGIQEWTHFLNRHHFLRPVVQGLGETGRERYAEYLERSIQSWISSNPVPLESNGGAGPSWETLTTAWRLREWLWLKGIAFSSEAFSEETRRLVLRSVWEHARSLMDHRGHPNNWIIVESAALALVGMVFPEFRESPQWSAEGITRLSAEFSRQFLSDGVHFEISPLYHAICLGAYLEVRSAANARSMSLPNCFHESLEHCFDYLAALCRPDFSWPSLNDSGGAAGDYAQLILEAGNVFHRPDLTWVGTGGCEGSPPVELFRVFPDAGIVTMRSSHEPDAHFLVFRAGPPGAAHTHGDSLSLDVTAFGIPRLLDPGITTYAPTLLTDYYRSAHAHNTLLIDGEGLQGRYAMNFAHRVRPAGKSLSWHKTGAIESATGVCRAHEDGGPGEWVVTRTVIFVKGEYWVVHDHVTGRDSHEVTACWQFSPGCVERDDESGALCCRDYRSSGFDLIPLPGSGRIALETLTGSTKPAGGWVAIHGADYPAPQFRFSLGSHLPVNMIWLLFPYAGRPVSGLCAKRTEEEEGLLRLEVAFPEGHVDVLNIGLPEEWEMDDTLCSSA